MDITIKNFTEGDGDQSLTLLLTESSFEAHKSYGPLLRRSMTGALVDKNAPKGPWNYTAYDNGNIVATLTGKPASWTDDDDRGIQSVLANLMRSGFSPSSKLSNQYADASRAIVEAKPDVAWIALNSGVDLRSTIGTYYTHPLEAALGKKRGTGRAMTKKSTAVEVKSWVDLCLAYGGSLSHRPTNNQGEIYSLSIGESALLYDPDTSRALCAESGIDLAKLLDKQFEKYNYTDEDGPSLLCWALSSGDDRWLSQVEKASTLWARPRPDSCSPIERVCADAMRKGDFLPLVAAHSLGHADFQTESTFEFGATDWFSCHRFDPCRLKKDHKVSIRAYQASKLAHRLLVLTDLSWLRGRVPCFNLPKAPRRQ